MKVVYDSVAIFDEKSQTVKFAGQIQDGKHGGRFIICHVPRNILIERFRLADPGPALLLECFLSVKGEIAQLATQKAMLGDYRPVIRTDEFLRASGDPGPQVSVAHSGI